jgi:hypothetical protein
MRKRAARREVCDNWRHRRQRMGETDSKATKQSAAEGRQARLAAELRANLKKRKAKTRAAGGPSRGPGKDTKKPD